MHRITCGENASPYAQNLFFGNGNDSDDKHVVFKFSNRDKNPDLLKKTLVRIEMKDKIGGLKDGLTPDGKIISWISVRNNSSNIFVRALNGGAALQRTNRRRVLDFNYSPDGSKLCFSESDGRTNRIFTTNADKGYVCKQITYNEWDYSPIYSADLKHIYFTREEKGNAFGIWRYDLTES